MLGGSPSPAVSYRIFFILVMPSCSRQRLISSSLSGRAADLYWGPLKKFHRRCYHQSDEEKMVMKFSWCLHCCPWGQMDRLGDTSVERMPCIWRCVCVNKFSTLHIHQQSEEISTEDRLLYIGDDQGSDLPFLNGGSSFIF